MAGQVLGGVLVQFTSWRAVFLVNVPVGLLAAGARAAAARDPRPGQACERRLDAGGALLITAAMPPLVVRGLAG